MARKYIYFGFLIFLIACEGDIADNQQDEQRITIVTLDEKGAEFRASRVSWWPSDSPDDISQLDCVVEECSSWVLPNDIVGSITIKARAQVEWENDPYCEDWYSGEDSVDIDDVENQKIELVLTFEGAVCAEPIANS